MQRTDAARYVERCMDMTDDRSDDRSAAEKATDAMWPQNNSGGRAPVKATQAQTDDPRAR
jgi:hypothetical protein